MIESNLVLNLKEFCIGHTENNYVMTCVNQLVVVVDIENVGIVERVDYVENIEDVEHLCRFMVQFGVIRADKIIEIKLFIKF